MDYSNGYESIASDYIAVRNTSAIGTAEVETWVGTLAARSTVLDIGCGHGVPATQSLLAAGHQVFAIDASESMIHAFARQFPEVPARCEPVERSDFFDRQYDATIAIGLVFLLPESAQRELIRRIGRHLHPGGKFLFTAPVAQGSWPDAMTGKTSLSLGKAHYARAIAAAGMSLSALFTDVGGNNYYSCLKSAHTA